MKGGAAHEIQALKRQLTQAEIANEKIRRHLVDAIPTTWLDPLLTGATAVVKEPPFNCKDIERLLRALKERMQQIVKSAQANPDG